MMLLALASLATAAEPAKKTAAKPICQDDGIRSAQAKRPAGPHKLGEEPNADAVLTVLRTVDGCSRPVKIREDVGGR